MNFREWLSYEPTTGIFRWLKMSSNKAPVGTIAGASHCKGYISIKVRGHTVLAHRLAWWFHYGAFPKNQIDHINCDKTDNRIANLREATNAQNHANRGAQRNNTSGIKGVYWFKPQKAWKAQIVVNGKSIHLGCFKTKDEAANARRAGEKLHQKEFAHRRQ